MHPRQPGLPPDQEPGLDTGGQGVTQRLPPALVQVVHVHDRGTAQRLGQGVGQGRLPGAGRTVDAYQARGAAARHGVRDERNEVRDALGGLHGPIIARSD